jgi:hypothetical protein
MTQMTDVEQAFVLDPKHPHRAQVLSNLMDCVVNLPRDKAWRIEIGPQIATRSGKQNRTFHMWCNQIATQLGWGKAYTKAYFKGLFGPLVGEVIREDKVIEIVKETSAYSVKEMSAVMTEMQVWANENGCVITIPKGEIR